MNSVKPILLTFFALLVVGSLFSQWQFTRQDNDTQAYVFGVQVLGERIVISGTTVAQDSSPVFVHMHYTELDFDGNIIKDTFIGNTDSSYLQVDLPNYYNGGICYHIVGKKNPALTGNLTIGSPVLVVDSLYNYHELKAFENYPENTGLVRSLIARLDNNKYLSIASTTYDASVYTGYMHIRIIDTLGNVQKEKVLSIFNRRLTCRTFHEFEGHYYFPTSRTQLDVSTNNQFSTLILYKLDTANLEVVDQIVIPGLNYTDFRATVLLENGDFILSCRKTLGYTEHPNPLMQFPIVVKALRKYDKNLNLIWEREIGNEGLTTGMIQNIRSVDSGHVLGIGMDTTDVYSAIYIFKVDTDGELRWFRKYTPLFDTLYPFGNFPYGFDFMPDGGYVVCGRSSGSFPMQYRGWVLRLNCLGFMGGPQAAFNAVGQGDLSWAFVNSSTEAGSFTWLMDDGTVYETPENADTLFHTFSDPSVEHTITLIAHGCNEEADTLVYVLPPHPLYDPNPQPEPPTPENGFFAIYPNPAQVGAPIHIVMNAQNNAEKIVFEFHSSASQLAASYDVPNEAAVFMLENNFAQGMYHVSMKVDGKVVARKKFVVVG